ncbi:YbfB/YjiJ family MFS transporter [Alcaligenaceae bacterium]|nr:YbfB/YjiJ family MFS transporter [Alcaligenaceae bacterium]
MQLVSGRGPLTVAIVGLVALAVAMGIGRFAFTPLLPLMLNDGGVTLAGGSWLATLNYIGYFVGAALCLFIRPDSARMVRIGLVATSLLTLAMALPGELWLWTIWRTASGVASAFVMVYTAGWCMQRLAEMGKASWAGIIFCGPGIGIATTGFAVFGLAAIDAHAAWGWALFGILAAILTVVVWPAFTSVNVTPGVENTALPAAPRLDAEAWGLTIGYGLAGFGYIITATFLPVIARQVLPGSLWADLFWPMFGVGAALGALATLKLGTRHDHRKLLTIAYCVQASGVMIAIVWPTVAGFALSSVLAGLPFTALVSFAMAEARRLWGPQAPRLMGLMTAVYGLGQISGPPLAAALVLRTGGFSVALACAASSLFVGALIFFVMRCRFVR